MADDVCKLYNPISTSGWMTSILDDCRVRVLILFEPSCQERVSSSWAPPKNKKQFPIGQVVS